MLSLLRLARYSPPRSSTSALVHAQSLIYPRLTTRPSTAPNFALAPRYTLAPRYAVAPRYALAPRYARRPQFGLAFSYQTEAMTGSTKDPADPSAVARICYISAVVYVAFVVFCGCQLMTHKRYPRGVQL